MRNTYRCHVCLEYVEGDAVQIHVHDYAPGARCAGSRSFEHFTVSRLVSDTTTLLTLGMLTNVWLDSNAQESADACGRSIGNALKLALELVERGAHPPDVKLIWKYGVGR